MSDVQSLVDGLAAVLQRPVAVDDRRLRAIAYSARSGTVDAVRMASLLKREASQLVAQWLESHKIATARAPVRIPANPALEASARICVPLRFEDTLLGYLSLMDEPVVDDAELRRPSRPHKRSPVASTGASACTRTTASTSTTWRSSCCTCARATLWQPAARSSTAGGSPEHADTRRSCSSRTRPPPGRCPSRCACAQSTPPNRHGAVSVRRIASPSQQEI